MPRPVRPRGAATHGPVPVPARNGHSHRVWLAGGRWLLQPPYPTEFAPRSSLQWNLGSGFPYRVREVPLSHIQYERRGSCAAAAASRPAATARMLDQVLHVCPHRTCVAAAGCPFADGHCPPFPRSSKDSRANLRQRQVEIGDLIVPVPANGQWYQAVEALRLLIELKQKGVKLRAVVEYWREKKWICHTYKRVMAMMQRAQEAMARGSALESCVREWQEAGHVKTGRPSYMTDAEFKDFVLEHSKRTQGEPPSVQDVLDNLAKRKAEFLEMHGKDGSDAKVCMKSAKRYLATLAASDGEDELPLEVKEWASKVAGRTSRTKGQARAQGEPRIPAVHFCPPHVLLARACPKVAELDLVEDEQALVTELHKLGVKKDSDLKYISKTDLHNASLSPVSKAKIQSLAESLGASFVSTVGASFVTTSDIAPWLASVGIPKDDVNKVVHHLGQKDFGVKTLKILLALEGEDVDTVLRGLPLGQRNLIKKCIQAGSPEGSALHKEKCKEEA